MTGGALDKDVTEVVAWALFAGADATYVAGEYQPSDTELELAGKLIETLRGKGYAVVPATIGREVYLVPDGARD